jgi:cytochrome c biogenesis protein
MSEKIAVWQGKASRARGKYLKTTWCLLSSMRAGLGILLLIAVSAMVGIVYEDLYTSWYFRILESLLCLNIAFCSMRRFLRLWRETFLRKPDFPLDIRDLTASYSATVPLQSASSAEEILNGMGYKTSRHTNENVLFIYGERGRISPWGTFLVHISILLIVLGGLIGSLFGFDTEVTLPVGSVYTVKTDENDKFAIRLDGFKTEHYQDGTVSDWISDITVENNGQQILSREVKVNYPLSYHGIKIYQKSYGTAFKAQIIDEKGAIVTERLLAEKDKLKLDENSDTIIEPVRYIPDFDALRPMVSRSPKPNNPYILYIVYSGGREISWGAAPVGSPLKLGHSGGVCFSEVVPVSGLQLKHDPGLQLVFLGFILMICGFFVSLYIAHSTLWLVITDDCEWCTVKLYISKTAEHTRNKIAEQFIGFLSVDTKKAMRRQ